MWLFCVNIFLRLLASSFSRFSPFHSSLHDGRLLSDVLRCAKNNERVSIKVISISPRTHTPWVNSLINIYDLWITRHRFLISIVIDGWHRHIIEWWQEQGVTLFKPHGMHKINCQLLSISWNENIFISLDCHHRQRVKRIISFWEWMSVRKFNWITFMTIFSRLFAVQSDTKLPTIVRNLF